MTIRGCLVYNVKTGKLMGFTDNDNGAEQEWLHDVLDTEERNEHQSSIASKLLQFQWLSLDNKFQFGVSYYLVSTTTGTQIQDKFFENVGMLLAHNFRVVGAVCDGAAENRTFMELAGREGLHQLFVGQFDYDDDVPFCMLNPHDPSWPIFLISDPNHNTKKGRNQLYKSGLVIGEGPCTRSMEMDYLPMVWEMIVDVWKWDNYHADKRTFLTEAHIFLTAFSLMKVSLATAVFDPRVFGGTSVEANGVRVHNYGGLNRTEDGERCPSHCNGSTPWFETLPENT